MADIQLQKPAAGQTTTIAPAPEDRLVLQFETGDATLTREGDNLNMSFEDGSSVSLTNFYQAYTADNMPTFVVGDAEIGGEQFFAGMAENLMPAAGPGAGATPTSGGTTVDTIAGTLLGGIDRLDGLDQSYPATAFAAAPADAALNAAPTITGITIFPDAGPDAFPNGLDVIESGVGRDVDGSFSPDTPNRVFGGEFFASGQVNATDPEGDALTFSILGSGQGQFGDLTINATDGIFSYSFRDGNANAMNEGESYIERFTIIVEDIAGNQDTREVVVTVMFTNDRPVLTLGEGGDTEIIIPPIPNTGSLGEIVTKFPEEYQADIEGSIMGWLDTPPNFREESWETFYTGLLEGMGLLSQSGSALQVKEDATGDDGGLNSNADGKASSTDDDRADAATGGQDDVPTYFVSGVDAFRYFDNDTNPDNNLVERADVDGNTVVDARDDAYNDRALVETTDANGVASGNTVGSSVMGTFGVFGVNPTTGSFDYTLYQEGQDGFDNVQALREGESTTETFFVYVQDQYGAWDAKPVTVTVIGSNDQPEIVIDPQEVVLTEEGVGDGDPDAMSSTPNADFEDTPSVSGTVTLSDVDAKDMLTLHFNNANGIVDIESATTYYVVPVDTNNDGNVDGYDLVDTMPADNAYIGDITFTTNDSGNNVQYDYLFNLNNNNDSVNGLNEGEVLTPALNLDLIVKDDSGAVVGNGSESDTNNAELSFTIKGTNDQPILTFKDEDDTEAAKQVTVTARPNADGGASVSGQMQTDDVDLNDTATYFVSYLNPNLLSDATYDQISDVLKDIRDFKDGVKESPIMGQVVEHLEKLAAFDLGAVVESAEAYLDKLGSLLQGEFDKLEGEFDKLNGADVDGFVNNLVDNLQTQLGGELDKLEGLIGHPVGDVLVGTLTKLLDQEFDKVPTSDSLNDFVANALNTVEKLLTDSLDKALAGITAEYKEIAEQLDALIAKYPLDEALAMAGEAFAALETKLDDVISKVDNADRDEYQENNVLPDSAGNEAYGLYGMLTITNTDKDETNGVYTYTLYTLEQAEQLGPEHVAAYWALQIRDDGDAALPTEHFTIYVQDKNGAWDFKNISFNVQGVNDLPVIQYVTKELTVQEAGHGIMVGNENLENAPDPGKPAAAGIIVATDIDIETLTYGVDGGVAQSGTLELKDLVGDFGILGNLGETDVFSYDVVKAEPYGNLYLNSATGGYIFVIDQAKADVLDDGFDAESIFKMYVTDDQGAGEKVYAEDVKVTIEGTNDRPVLTIFEEDASGELVESDGKLQIIENTGNTPNSVGGTFTFTDVDDVLAKDDVSVGVTRPELGNETLVALYNAFLDAKNVPADSPLYDIANSDAFAKLYEIVGDDINNPILEQLDKLDVLNQLKYGEVSSDGHTVYGLYGKMELAFDDQGNPTGEYTYTLYTWDEAKGSVDTALAFLALQRRDDDDALPTENFTIYVKDDNDAWDYKNVTIEVKGYDDAPTISGDLTAEVIEAGVGGYVLKTTIGNIVDSVVDSVLPPALDGLLGGFKDEISSDIKGFITETLDSDIFSQNIVDDGKPKVEGQLEIKDDDGIPLILVEDAKLEFHGEVFLLGLVSNLKDFNIAQDIIENITGVFESFDDLSGILDGSFDPSDLEGLLNTIPELAGLLSIDGMLESILDTAKLSISQTVTTEYGEFTIKPAGMADLEDALDPFGDILGGGADIGSIVTSLSSIINSLFNDDSKDEFYTYEYELNNDALSVKELNEGESAQDTITVKAYDKFGQVTEQKVVVNITGNNDKPEFDEPTVEKYSINADDTNGLGGTVSATDDDSTGKQGDTLEYFVDGKLDPQELALTISQEILSGIKKQITANEIAIETAENAAQAELDNLATLEDTLGSEASGGIFGIGAKPATGLYKELENASDADKAAILQQIEQAKTDIEIAKEDCYGDFYPYKFGSQLIIEALEGFASSNDADFSALSASLNPFLGNNSIEDLLGSYGALGQKVLYHFGLDELSAKNAIYEDLLEVLEGDGTEEGIVEALKEHLDFEDFNLPEGVEDGLDAAGKFDVQEGVFGIFKMEVATGEWTYDLTDEGRAKLKALGEGETPVDENGKPIVETFTVYVQDENGAWDYKEIEVTIKGVNDAPVINSVINAQVSEVFLPDGTGYDKDNVPSADIDPTDGFTAATAIGKITATDAEGDTLTFAWDGTGPELWTSEGDKVSWSVDPNNPDMLVGYLEDNTEKYQGTEKQVMTLVFMKDAQGKYTGEYTVELKESVHHDDPNELGSDHNTDYGTDTGNDTDHGNSNLAFGFNVSDGNGATTPEKLTVQIQDDVIEMTNKMVENGADLIKTDVDIVLDDPDKIPTDLGKTTWSDPDSNVTIEAGKVVGSGPDGSTYGDFQEGTGVLQWSSKVAGDAAGGLYIDSGDNDPTGLDRVDFVKDGENSYSEALKISVNNGTASGVVLNLGALFGGPNAGGNDDEAAYVRFYNGEECVFEREIAGFEGTGEFTLMVPGNFTHFEVYGVDNGASPDNSDFTLSGLKLLTVDNITTFAGQADAIGADEQHYFDIINTENSSFTVDQENSSKDVLYYTDEKGNTLSIDTDTGAWILVKKNPLESVEFNIKATDADGDTVVLDEAIIIEATIQNSSAEVAEGDLLIGNVFSEGTMPAHLEVTEVTPPEGWTLDEDNVDSNLFVFTKDEGFGLFTFNKTTGDYELKTDDTTIANNHDDNNELRSQDFEFDYKIGDATASVTLTVHNNLFDHGTNEGGDILLGAKGHDILLGDLGGTEAGTETIAKNHNMAFVLDRSGSIDNADWTKMIDALESTLTKLSTSVISSNSIVNVGIIPFAASASERDVFSFSLDGKNDLEELTAAFAALEALRPSGATNYEDAFEAATQWFKDDATFSSDFLNNMYFVSDGEPTVSNREWWQIFQGPKGRAEEEFENLEKYLASKGGLNSSVIAVGDKDASSGFLWWRESFHEYLKNFDTDGNIPYAKYDEFETILDDTVVDILPANAGNDSISGGEGNDILIGDSLNANFMLEDGWLGKSTDATWKAGLNDGDSFAIVDAYLKAAVGGKYTDNDLRDFIKENIDSLSMTDPKAAGGDDTLHGGAGDDILIGGAGVDILDGGEGDDIIFAAFNDKQVFGGKGNDIISLEHLDSINIHDVLVDGGEGMDILLTAAANQAAVEQMLSSGKITNTEVIMFGGDVDEAKALQGDIKTDATGKLDESSLTNEGWKTDNTVKNYNGVDYKEFKSDDDSMTILVQQTMNLGG